MQIHAALEKLFHSQQESLRKSEKQEKQEVEYNLFIIYKTYGTKIFEHQYLLKT
jgi:hypothetical protein